MTRLIKSFSSALIIIAVVTSSTFAQHSHDHSGTKDKPVQKKDLPSGLSVMNPKDKADSSKSDHKHVDMKTHDNMNMDTSKKNNKSIVRKGDIDLNAIDINKDGKVYQDQMDWNVISDEPGKCPLCKMTLEEVTIKKAKENLIKNKFKVK